MAQQQQANQYEALFLISQGVAAEFQAVIDHLNEIFRRAHADVVSMKKWDERRLAYEIDKQKRGVYILAYFTAPSAAIDHIHRDVNLSEKILRCMIIRADHLTVEEMKAADSRQAMEDEARLRGGAREEFAEEIPELDEV